MAEHAAHRTVLVVDDEVVLRELLDPHLTRMGYRVSTAPDGATAVRLVVEEIPDVALLDIRTCKGGSG